MKKDDNISFLEEFIGSKWLSSEFNKINTKSPSKELGSLVESYHPWVHFMYETRYLLRKANTKYCNNIIMGRYHNILDNAGMLLKYNYSYIHNKKDAQMKLRHPKQFYDFIWELEIRTMLEQCGASADFVEPKGGKTYDGNLIISERSIPFECKNKVLDNERYNTNFIFLQILVNKIKNLESIQNQIIQIEFESGRLEDINTIVTYFKDQFDSCNCQSILGRYKVQTFKKLPFDIPADQFMKQTGVTQMFLINEVLKKELHLKNSPNKVVKSKLLIKMPEAVYKLKNLNVVLKKANSQLSSGGIVFLMVPYTTFESAKNEIQLELSKYFSNIYAVKLVSLDISYIENHGVKISRLEDLIVSPKGKVILSQKEISFLNQSMIFSKYDNRVKNLD
jgi:hypothetical protein